MVVRLKIKVFPMRIGKRRSEVIYLYNSMDPARTKGGMGGRVTGGLPRFLAKSGYSAGVDCGTVTITGSVAPLPITRSASALCRF
jgi:hypothetical protein